MSASAPVATGCVPHGAHDAVVCNQSRATLVLPSPQQLRNCASGASSPHLHVAAQLLNFGLGRLGPAGSRVAGGSGHNCRSTRRGACRGARASDTPLMRLLAGQGAARKRRATARHSSHAGLQVLTPPTPSCHPWLVPRPQASRGAPPANRGSAGLRDGRWMPRLPHGRAANRSRLRALLVAGAWACPVPTARRMEPPERDGTWHWQPIPLASIAAATGRNHDRINWPSQLAEGCAERELLVSAPQRAPKAVGLPCRAAERSKERWTGGQPAGLAGCAAGHAGCGAPACRKLCRAAAAAGRGAGR